MPWNILLCIESTQGGYVVFPRLQKFIVKTLL